MRKGLLVLTLSLICLLFFSSCSSKNSTPQQITLDFSAKIYIEEDYLIKADLDYASQGRAVIRIAEPKRIQGLTIKWQSGEYSIGLDELEYKYNMEYLPSESHLVSVVHVLSAMKNMEQLTLIKNEEDISHFSGNCQSGDFTVAVENETTFVKSIIFTDTDVTVDFSRVRLYA